MHLRFIWSGSQFLSQKLKFQIKGVDLADLQRMYDKMQAEVQYLELDSQNPLHHDRAGLLTV